MGIRTPQYLACQTLSAIDIHLWPFLELTGHFLERACSEGSGIWIVIKVNGAQQTERVRRGRCKETLPSIRSSVQGDHGSRYELRLRS